MDNYQTTSNRGQSNRGQLSLLDQLDDLHSLDELFARSRDYRKSKDYKEMMKFIIKFRQYSPYNCFLIRMQNPNVSYVARAKHWWDKFGRTVKEDARPMVILVPFGPVAFVYDLEDTAGGELPADIAQPFRTDGTLKQKIMDNTIANALNRRIKVVEKTLSRQFAGQARHHKPNPSTRVHGRPELDPKEPHTVALPHAHQLVKAGATNYTAFAEAMLDQFGEPIRRHMKFIYLCLYYSGQYDQFLMTDPNVLNKLDDSRIGLSSRFEITLNKNHPLETRYATLVHELAHLLCGHLGRRDKEDSWKDRRDLSKDIVEIEAESVSYLVCRRQSLNTNADSYLSSYIQDHEELPAISFHTVLTVAGEIEAMGQRKPPKKQAQKQARARKAQVSSTASSS